jgi:hypothetical protein
MKTAHFFMGAIVPAALAVMLGLAGCGSLSDPDKPITLDAFEDALRAREGGLRPADPVDIAYFGSGNAYDLYRILAKVSKYVNLDLSESSVAGFEDAVHPSGSAMIISLILPDKLTYIGDRAFYEWDRLAEVTIPKSVLTIGDYAFSGCSRLAGLTIPSGVASIGKNAFNGCIALTRVTIPSGVASIGDDAFSSCNALAGVTFQGNSTSVASDSAFPSGANLRTAAGGSGTGAYQPNAGTYQRNDEKWWRT